jgi:hypothetical protein
VRGRETTGDHKVPNTAPGRPASSAIKVMENASKGRERTRGLAFRARLIELG